MLTQLASAANPAIYTIFYDEGGSGRGETMTCQEAWGELDAMIASTSGWGERVQEMCRAAGFDPNVGGELNICRNLFQNTIQTAFQATVSPEKAVETTLLGHLFADQFYQGHPYVSALQRGNQQIAAAGIAAGLTFAEWMPIMRGVMTAVAIGLIPFLVLFIPTPLFTKGLSVMVGFFIFLCTWGIADATLHHAAMDHAIATNQPLASDSGGHLGVRTAISFPDQGTKTQAMFGNVCASAVSLAAFLTFMLVRFGGYALTAMAGSMQGTIGQGAAAGGQVLTPQGQASAMQSEQRAAQSAAVWDSIRQQGGNPALTATKAGAHGELRGMGAQLSERKMAEQLQKEGVIGDGNASMAMGAASAAAGYKVADQQGRQVSGGADAQGQFGSSAAGRNIGGERHNKWDVNTTQNQATGAENAKWQSGAGTMEFMTDSDGNTRLTAANINGVGGQVASRVTEGLSSDFSQTAGLQHNHEKMMQQINRDSETNSTAAEVGRTVANETSSGIARGITQNSAELASVRSETGESVGEYIKHQKEIAGQAGLSLPSWSPISLGATAGTSLADGKESSITATNAKGETTTFQLSESQARTFQEIQKESQSAAWKLVAQDQQQVQYAASAAEKVGATDVSQAADRLSYAQENSAGFSQDLQVLAANHMAGTMNNGGADNPANVSAAVERMNQWATSGNPADSQRLEQTMMAAARSAGREPTGAEVAEGAASVRGGAANLAGSVGATTQAAGDRAMSSTEPGQMEAGRGAIDEQANNLGGPGDGSELDAEAKSLREKNRGKWGDGPENPNIRPATGGTSTITGGTGPSSFDDEHPQSRPKVVDR